MSVLIKDMAIPPNCFMCNLSYMKGERLFCSVTREEVIRAKRAIECSIIEIPPHGRLIDADSLLERFEKEEKAADEHGRDFSFSFKSGGENCTEWWSVQQMLMDAPTIIPAEPPKEE